MVATCSIVVTTIYEPAFLAGFLDNLRTYGRSDSAEVVIIVDRKTPASVTTAAARAASEGYRVRCPSLAEQEEFLRRIGAPPGFIPYDSDNRRNVGFLMAIEQGSEALISIDDDNLCPTDVDFVGEHLAPLSGGPLRGPCRWVSEGVPGTPGWFNVCGLLELQPPIGAPVFPRGFPYRHRESGDATCSIAARPPAGSPPQIGINVGMWRGDPDVDAVTRLCLRPHGERLREGSTSTYLGANVWSPINTQNTAIARALLPAYYYVRMGARVGGHTIDRYGDILSGYFVAKCAKVLGLGVRIGSPVTTHRRSPHNLFKDLHHELAGMVIVEDLLPWLTEVPLAGSSPMDVYQQLAESLRERAERFKGFVWDDGGREFVRSMCADMRTWLDLVKRVAGP